MKKLKDAVFVFFSPINNANSVLNITLVYKAIV